MRPGVVDDLPVAAALQTAHHVGKLLDGKRRQVAVFVGVHVLKVNAGLAEQKLLKDGTFGRKELDEHLHLFNFPLGRLGHVVLAIEDVVPLFAQHVGVREVGTARGNVLDKDENVGHQAGAHAVPVDLLLGVVGAPLQVKLDIARLVLILCGVHDVRPRAIGERSAVCGRLGVAANAERATVGADQVRLVMQRVEHHRGPALDAVLAHCFDRARVQNALLHLRRGAARPA
ncbi:MAG: hypothetical protein CMD92_07045 [Gammaproteobacteria bacterium]|nr:hypothetical protein [Gammaproteobacteria bacterium]